MKRLNVLLLKWNRRDFRLIFFEHIVATWKKTTIYIIKRNHINAHRIYTTLRQKIPKYFGMILLAYIYLFSWCFVALPIFFFSLNLDVYCHNVRTDQKTAWAVYKIETKQIGSHKFGAVSFLEVMRAQCPCLWFVTCSLRYAWTFPLQNRSYAFDDICFSANGISSTGKYSLIKVIRLLTFNSRYKHQFQL